MNGFVGRNIVIAALMVSLCAISGPLAASSRTPAKLIAGYVEKITLTPWDITVAAKLDTGALTSSISAEDIQRFRKGEERWVRFTLVAEDAQDQVHRFVVERPLVRRVRIKDRDEGDRRLSVELDFCFDGRPRGAEFTLADRKDFIYPVLLGRRFLEQVAIIDPAQTFLTQAHCQMRGQD